MTPRCFTFACLVVASLLVVIGACFPRYGMAQNLNGIPGMTVAQLNAIVQSTNTTTDGSGNFSVTWNTAFQSSTPFVAAFPVNGGAQPIECIVSSRTATTVAGKCLQTQIQTVALISLTINIAPINAAGVVLMVVGRDTTQ